jgi:sulfur dioxygenase
MSYLIDNKLFTGDSLFIRSTGRCDFQGGSAKTLYKSIHKLFELPDSTEVYPAHDYNGFSVSTIGEEKKFNSMIKETFDQKTFIKNVDSLKLDMPKKIKASIPANQSCGLIPAQISS